MNTMISDEEKLANIARNMALRREMLSLREQGLTINQIAKKYNKTKWQVLYLIGKGTERGKRI
jgi:orotate phosphoribosyltransferase-like protein